MTCEDTFHWMGEMKGVHDDTVASDCSADTNLGNAGLHHKSIILRERIVGGHPSVPAYQSLTLPPQKTS
jgi:hypothetical protein